MKLLSKKSDVAKALNTARQQGLLVGLVPTMGALHEGHLSLIGKALQENDIVVVSIFVNPTQFDRKEDLDSYPRTLDSDLLKLKDLKGDLLVFAPTIEEIYSKGVHAQHYDLKGLDSSMEGAFRKGHFQGVGTVVSLLFELIRPNRAYFGEKDYQQLLIIEHIAASSFPEIQIVRCAILREPNGLAMSSRNGRLNSKQRDEGKLLYSCLNLAKARFYISQPFEIEEEIRRIFDKNPDFSLEYFVIADARDLSVVQQLPTSIPCRAFIAAFIGSVRLIDNIALN